MTQNELQLHTTMDESPKYNIKQKKSDTEDLKKTGKSKLWGLEDACLARK